MDNEGDELVFFCSDGPSGPWEPITAPSGSAAARRYAVLKFDSAECEGTEFKVGSSWVTSSLVYVTDHPDSVPVAHRPTFTVAIKAIATEADDGN